MLTALGERDAFVETEQFVACQLGTLFTCWCVFDDHDDVVGPVQQLFGQVIECFRYELLEASTRHVHTAKVRARNV